MQTKEKKGLIFIRLFPNEDIFERLEEACRKYDVKTAVVLSGIGQLKEFCLGYFKKKGDYTPQEFITPCEMLSLEGNISKQGGDYNFHLHIILGNKDKSVIGGHLIKGRVEVTNEIVLLRTDIEIRRELEENTGLKGMFLEHTA